MLCSSDKIEIDITLQRMLDIIHACNIIDHFKQIMVMPICVYEDPARPGKYICWDGQHTAIVLYILATKIFGQRVDELMVPVVVYSVKQKAEIHSVVINMPIIADLSVDGPLVYQGADTRHLTG